MPKELDKTGFVFIGEDNNAYRCCLWGERAWLFRWRNGEKQWESLRPLTQMDIWLLPHNLSSEQQALYFKAETQTTQSHLSTTE